MSYVGRIYKRKTDHGDGTFRVTGANHESPPSWILERLDAFESPLAVLPHELRAQFVKAADAPDAAPAADAGAIGWQRLSAEAKLASLAVSADAGDLQPGDPSPFSGREVSEKHVQRLRRLAGRTSGRRAPTPEDVFTGPEAIQVAADKIWSSDGPDGLLIRFELGRLVTHASGASRRSWIAASASATRPTHDHDREQAEAALAVD